jgi:DNA recombination protein RmuC
MEVLYLTGGFIAGGLIVWLALRNRGKGRQEYLEEKLKGTHAESESLKRQVEAKEEEIRKLGGELAISETNLKNLEEKLSGQKNEINELQEKFRLEFKNLANEILEEKSKRFTEQNKTNLDTLLKPLGEKIRDFEKKVEETYDKETAQRISLKEKVVELTKLNETLGAQAEKLTHALKGDSKAQGNWGEMILESILEKSGLVKEREYFVQQSFTLDDGSRLQPDVIVSYPGERSVIIDAKVSLTAYERYINEDDPDAAARHLKDHISSIRSHVVELGNKEYLEIYKLQTLDFIMMFLPVEPAYLLAIREDPELWNFAYEKRILIISPTNLLAALKMIASLWRQEYQNKNALEIARQSGDLLDKFYALLNDLNDLGNKLNATRKSYDDAVNKLSEGRGNLIRRAQKIQELGAKAKKKIPDGFNSLSEEGD